MGPDTWIRVQAHDLQKGSQVTIDINKYPSSANFAFGESKIKPKQTTKQAADHEINKKAIKDVRWKCVDIILEDRPSIIYL